MGEGRGETHFSSSTHTGGPPVRAQVVGTSPRGMCRTPGNSSSVRTSATGTTRGPSSYGPNCTALSGSECSAAGWLAFGIPSACALTCVRLVPECVWSPSLASRARLLALYPGCGLREPSGGCGPAGSGRAGFWRIVWRRASRLCLAICWRRRRRSGACWGRGGGGRRKAPVLRIKESAKKR